MLSHQAHEDEQYQTFNDLAAMAHQSINRAHSPEPFRKLPLCERRRLSLAWPLTPWLCLVWEVPWGFLEAVWLLSASCLVPNGFLKGHSLLWAVS